MKILTIVGASPQFIKAAAVSRAIAQHNQDHATQKIEEIIVHTGQHYDSNMSEVFFREMQIPQPQYNLGIHGGTHGAMTGKMLEKIEEVLLSENSDVVLVYGDTNSTLAGALAAVKLHIPVAHVEAGLRSFNRKMPEEINRLLTDQISDWLFCPTETAVKNLENEGIGKTGKARVFKVGDVMYDAVLFYRQISQPTKAIASLIQDLGSNFYLATVHRAENTNNLEHLTNILEALETISQNIPVVLPLHPRTRQLFQVQNFPSIHILEPVGYFDMIALLSHCRGVITDSGGLQKEAYFFQKPCLTLRDETEWIELVEQGCNVLAGYEKDRVMNAEAMMRNKPIDLQKYLKDLYGKGNASEQIVKNLL